MAENKLIDTGDCNFAVRCYTTKGMLEFYFQSEFGAKRICDILWEDSQVYKIHIFKIKPEKKIREYI